MHMAGVVGKRRMCIIAASQEVRVKHESLGYGFGGQGSGPNVNRDLAKGYYYI